MSVSVSILNTGVAPLYYPARMLLTYPCSVRKNCTQACGPDLRTLLPSDKPMEVACGPVAVPASSNGEQGVSVGVSVSTAYALKPVRFAVDGADAAGVLWATSRDPQSTGLKTDDAGRPPDKPNVLFFIAVSRSLFQHSYKAELRCCHRTTCDRHSPRTGTRRSTRRR